jgi:glycosyltransferase involved in cell wall biosynthesis
MPRRIVGVASFMNTAGAPAALLRLGRQLRARGYEVEIIFLYEKGVALQDDENTIVLVKKQKLSPLEYLKVFFALKARLQAKAPDAVIGFLPLAAIFAGVAARLIGVRAVIASQRSPGPTFGRVTRFLDKICGATGIYSRIVCVSKAVEDSFSDYPQAYRQRLSVVHNGIEWHPQDQSRQNCRARWDLPSGQVVFLALGRTSYQKNYHFMLRGLAQAPGAWLLIAGDGELRGELEALADALGVTDRVRFLGNIDRAGVMSLLCAADVFVQTSLFEGQSNSVLEAMHAGLPMILSDISMQRETVCDDTAEPAALLVALDDDDALSAAMVSLRDDAALRETLGGRGKALVESRFGLAQMIDGFEHVIAEAYGQPQSGA